MGSESDEALLTNYPVLELSCLVLLCEMWKEGLQVGRSRAACLGENLGAGQFEL